MVLMLAREMKGRRELERVCVDLFVEQIEQVAYMYIILLHLLRLFPSS